MDDRRRVSQEQERRQSKKVGAKLHKGSGSGWLNPHDAHTETELYEYKTLLNKGKKSVTIKQEDLLSVERAAYGRLPVLQFTLGKEYVVLTADDFEEHKEIVNAARRERATVAEQQSQKSQLPRKRVSTTTTVDGTRKVRLKR